jgi:general secretion pathway protein G
MMLQAARGTTRRAGFTLMEVLVVVAILVILASVAIIAVPRYIDDARKNQALLRAQSLAQACESYNINPANDNGYPQSLNELLTPPFGGPSFLKNGVKDLQTPWNQPFNYEQRPRQDQTVVPYISTNAPDGTLISNFGIGDKATPQF